MYSCWHLCHVTDTRKIEKIQENVSALFMSTCNAY